MDKNMTDKTDKTVFELASEAIEEAKILESAFDVFNVNNMLLTAESLSNVPYFMVKEVYDRISE
jgi:hypothetical protein